MKRWAIYIDIEGFSALYPDGNDALWGLNKLMLATYRIGSMVYPNPVDRLFAHQLGDGFLIVSDFHEESLERAFSIATVLMKFITSFGVFARVSIAEGDHADVVGCYPQEVRDNLRTAQNKTADMGAGIMTIFPTMGTALINAVGIDKVSPKGPLFTAPRSYATRIPKEFKVTNIKNSFNMAIDWIHIESSLIESIATKALLKYPSPQNLEILIKKYIEKHKLKSEWVSSCEKYIGINHN